MVTCEKEDQENDRKKKIRRVEFGYLYYLFFQKKGPKYI